MKGGAFVLVVLIAGLMVAGRQVCTVSKQGFFRAPSMQSQGKRKAAQTLLADRIETNDSLIYTTDPDLERAMNREDKEEREKEYNSWKMLQHMYLNGSVRKRPPSADQGASPSQ